MIQDSINNLSKYLHLNPRFKIVEGFVAKQNLSALSPGKLELSEGVFANIDTYQTKTISDKFIECHKKYVDIQVVVKGEELAGVCDRDICTTKEEYSIEKDFEMLDILDSIETKMEFIELKPNNFAIFFPKDAHMPGLMTKNGISDIKKIVFKIPV